MRSISLRALFVAGVLVTPVEALADPVMEAQRCIMRCASSTEAKQPAYNKCIRDVCDAAPEPKRKQKQKQKSGWAPELRTSVQASVALLSDDGRHRLHLICGRNTSAVVSYSIYVEKTGKKSRIESGPGNLFADHDMFRVDIGGADDGWVLSNTLVNNVSSVTSELVDAFKRSSTIQLMSGTVEVEPAAEFVTTPNSEAYGAFLKACSKL